MTTRIRKSVLVFSFFPANFPPTSGGEQRLHSLYSAVSAHHDVIMLSSAAVVGEVERIVHNSNFVEYRVPKGEEFYQLWNNLERLQGYGDLSAIAIALMGETGTKLHELYLEHYHAADVIVHQFPFTLPYDVFWKLDDKPRIYSSENAEHVLYANMYSDEAVSDVGDYVRALEAALVQDADLIGYCSEIDIEAIKSLAPVKDEQTVFLPNGVLLGKPAVARKRRKKASRFLFLGSRHKPNQEAARFIVDELAPRLPGLTFDIAGECLPDGDYPANVTRHGFVSDAQLSALCASCDAAINPMTSGSGSNVKVFEFVCQDLPIVSTRFGMRGVAAAPGRDYLESSIANFADSLEALARDASALGGMAESMRASVAANHDWRLIGERLASRISRLERKGGAPMGGHVLALNDYNVVTAIGGGATRFRGNFGAVAARAPVFALCFSDDDRLTYSRTDEGVHVIAVPKTRAHCEDETSASARFYISVTDVLCARHVLDNPLMSKLYDVLRKDACRIVTEHPFMAPLPIARGDRFVYSSQNDESLLKASLFEYHPDRDDLMALVRSVEGAAVERADLVVTVSDEDRSSLSFGRATLPPMVTVRNGVRAVKPPGIVPGAEGKGAEEWVAVFIGSGHAPNYIAARYIVDHLAPACPDVIFTFIGSVCEGLIEESRPNIRLLGRLSDEDKSAVLWGASCALNAMADGSGSNVKLAEYFAHGLPVLTTPFGVRGYPPEVAAMCVVEPLSGFPKALNALRNAEAESKDVMAKRLRIFDEVLSLERLGAQFADVILPRAPIQRRALFVTYRWSDPDLGGSEAAMRHYINHLAEQPGVAVDVVSTDIKGIASHHRFGGRYTVEPTAAPTGAIDIRARRFVVDPSPSPDEKAMLERIWEVQGEFEKTWISAQADRLTDPALAWGWYDGETWSDGTDRRWSSGDSAIHLGKGGGKVRLSGVAPFSLGLALLAGDETPLWTGRLDGVFEIELDVDSDWLLLRAAVPTRPQVDPRPLAFALDAVLIDGRQVPFGLTAANRLQADPEGLYAVLADAARATRFRRKAELTRLRGPRSEGLERWLRDNVCDYDLIITHNPTFYPTTLAVRLAAEAGVPSVMVPHVHLDDDYYHFPDVIEAVTGATLSLVCPQSAADFLATAGAAVKHLTPGVDIDEAFTEADEEAFLAAGGPSGRFVLVLGRKAGAKNYKDVIATVDALAEEHDIQVVLIGPDDDGEPILSPNALYMGRQPREVVRGALRRAAALVSMSSSESFGIVILEAWTAGCPVIVRGTSSAFRELVQHGQTGLLTDPSTLQADIVALLTDPSMARRMARAGETAVRDYDWAAVGQRFVDACLALMTRRAEV